MADDTLIGKRLGQYEILSIIGRGPFSTVYRANQPGINRVVAVKVLPRDFLRDQSFLARFEREARILARLEHFHIVPIYDVGESNGLPYIVMRLMQGGTLTDLLKRRQKLSARELTPMVQQIGAALDYAHQRGVIHRDLKPNNVLFDGDGNAYLSDFGIARVREAIAAVTGSAYVGSPAYLAPEIGSSAVQLTPAVDVYSMGVILFEALAGQLPFSAEAPVKLAMKHINEPPPALRSIDPAIDPAVEDVVLRALAKNPRDRYERAGMLARAFSNAVGITTSAVRQFDITDRLKASQANQETPLLQPVPPELFVQKKTDTASRPTPRFALARAGRDREKKERTPPPATKRERPKPERPAPVVRRPSWYSVILSVLLVIMVFFILGAQIGLETRRAANIFVLGAINATQTAEAGATASVAAQTAEAATQQAAIVAETATATAAIPTDTPTPTLTPTHTPTLTPTPFAGAGQRIVLVSERDGDPEIFVLDLATRALTQITDNRVADGLPRWSPDGRLIAYQSNETTGGRHIFVVEPSGKNRRELTRGIRVDGSPIWHPDGSVIAFYSNEAGRSWIRQISVNGEVEIDLLQVPAGTGKLLDWSPDGSTIFMYGFGVDAVLNILAVDIANGERVAVTNALGDIQYLDFSPDRSTVVFTATSQGRIQLYLADTDCEDGILNRCNVRRLTNDRNNWRAPRFSPDGTLILVTSDRAGNDDLWLIDLNGQVVDRLTSSPFKEYDGDWERLPSGSR